MVETISHKKGREEQGGAKKGTVEWIKGRTQKGGKKGASVENRKKKRNKGFESCRIQEKKKEGRPEYGRGNTMQLRETLDWGIGWYKTGRKKKKKHFAGHPNKKMAKIHRKQTGAGGSGRVTRCIRPQNNRKVRVWTTKNKEKKEKEAEGGRKTTMLTPRIKKPFKGRTGRRGRGKAKDTKMSRWTGKKKKTDGEGRSTKQQERTQGKLSREGMAWDSAQRS